MKKWRFIEYGCFGVYGAMMSVCGYNFTTWPFWVGIFLLAAVYCCGSESRDAIWRLALKEIMIKRSVEDKNTIYVCTPWCRYVFRNGEYIGWYKP